MGCEKAKLKGDPTPGDFRCKKCGAVAAKPKRLCKPREVKAKDAKPK